MRILLIACIVVLALASGCGEKVAANVSCVTVATPAVECEVTETKGKSEIEICWDFQATCENGVLVKAARTCQKVKGGGMAKAVIGADKLDGVDKCAGSTPPKAEVLNITINGNKGE